MDVNSVIYVVICEQKVFDGATGEQRWTECKPLPLSMGIFIHLVYVRKMYHTVLQGGRRRFAAHTEVVSELRITLAHPVHTESICTSRSSLAQVEVVKTN